MQGIKNEKLKKEAIRLRRLGESYPMINRKLWVSKSTLSGWISGLELSEGARRRIGIRKKNNLIKLRENALRIRRVRKLELNHNLQEAVLKDFTDCGFGNRIKELLLAMLYLGEGFKGRSCIGLGNSNPDIMRLFVKLVRDIHVVDEKKFRCFLHLRMDQKEVKEKSFWSREVGIPLSGFRKTQFDKRTAGKKTWKNYHGVCIVYYYDASVDKRLTEVQKMIIKKILGS